MKTRKHTLGEETSSDLNSPAAIRARFHLSQSEFAALIGINLHTLQQWEQGKRKPSGPAKRLLRVVADHPEVFNLECPKTPQPNGETN